MNKKVRNVLLSFAFLEVILFVLSVILAATHSFGNFESKPPAKSIRAYQFTKNGEPRVWVVIRPGTKLFTEYTSATPIWRTTAPIMAEVIEELPAGRFFTRLPGEARLNMIRICSQNTYDKRILNIIFNPLDQAILDTNECLWAKYMDDDLSQRVFMTLEAIATWDAYREQWGKYQDGLKKFLDSFLGFPQLLPPFKGMPGWAVHLIALGGFMLVSWAVRTIKPKQKKQHKLRPVYGK